MADFLYSIDLSIFNFINQTISNNIFDKFFPFITNVKNWYLVYIVLWFILFLKGGKIGKPAAIVILFLIAASDQISSNLLKNLFQRIRPCNALDNVNILVNCSKSFSFPSSHAVNNFAVATFFSRLYPKLRWILLIIAALIAFSRPYVGVHYPSDIFFGALIGSALGYFFSIITLKISKNKYEK
ncbi:MAG: phosphatase PAP2 family protein [Ignavibacteriae bacterium]|nr:MAG: phosphatase PAP2 family protein [Ignavibacteriota bacterium]